MQYQFNNSVTCFKKRKFQLSKKKKFYKGLCRSSFVLLYFFLWPLCCLSFFDLWILIIPLQMDYDDDRPVAGFLQSHIYRTQLRRNPALSVKESQSKSYSQKWWVLCSFAYLRWRRRDVCNFHMIYIDDIIHNCMCHFLNLKMIHWINLMWEPRV
jgi:hypothetical protein